MRADPRDRDSARSSAIEENKRRAWESFEARETRLEGMPFRASIEITRNCNYRCTMCPQSWMPEYAQYRPEFNMTPELFERVARELFPHLEYAHLQGFGESVISPHWPRILDLCEASAAKPALGLVTNLGRKDDEMWRRLVRMGVRIRFSCDGATRETFEDIRRRGSFAMILENLELIRGAARETPGKGSALAFNVTLQRRNIRELPLFIELAARFEVREVQFASVQKNLPRTAPEAWATLRKLAAMPAAHALAHARRRVSRAFLAPEEEQTLEGLPAEELAGLKERTLRLARENGVRVSFTDAFLEGIGNSAPRRPGTGGIEESGRVAENQRCFKPYSYTVVNYKGDVGLCNHLISDDGWERMGSLQESSFKEIWNSSEYRRARSLLAGGTPASKACRWCFAHRLGE